MGLLCDFHIHSNFSDGQHSLEELIEIYGRRKFDVIAITDHVADDQTFLGQFAHRLNCSLKPNQYDEYFSELRKMAKKAWEKYSLIVIPGFEITRNSFLQDRSSHFLVLGEVPPLDPRHDIIEALKHYRNQGALTIAAHPLSTGKFEFQTLQLWKNRDLYAPYFDAWEVNCGRKFYNEVLHSGLPIVASTDLHHERQIDCWKTSLDCVKDRGEIFQAIKEQHLSVVEYSSQKCPSQFAKIKSIFMPKLPNNSLRQA